MGGLKTKGAIFQQDWELKGECHKEELNEGFVFSFKLALGGGGGDCPVSSLRDCDGNSRTLSRVLL